VTPCDDTHQFFTGIFVKWFFKHFVMFADSFSALSIHFDATGLGASFLHKCHVSRGGPLRQHGLVFFAGPPWLAHNSWTESYTVAIQTRMLAINVSIPNLTVARLEQFRSPQMTENKPSFTRKPHVVIFCQSPFAANAVPKLVAMATPLDPRSRLCLHWIACPRKHTPRIKQRVASCHTAEVISIQSLPAPPHTPRGTADFWGGVVGLPPCLVWTSSHSYRLTLLFYRFPDFPRIRNGGLKVSILGPQIGTNWGFSPLNFRGTYEHP